MSRKPLIRNSILPFHVTARSNNGEEFYIPLDALWELMKYEIGNICLVFGAEIHAFVLMPNHFHLLLTVPELDLGRVMQTFMARLTKAMNRNSGRSGRHFGGPYYRSLIESSVYFAHAFKYVYRNPVKAGLCSQVENYPFSTLQGLLGMEHLAFPIFYTRRALELSFPTIEFPAALDWLNRPFPKEAEELIRKGLKKKVFENLRDGKTRRPPAILAQQL